MSNYLHRNPRLLVLIVALIAIAGTVAFNLLPRMEDPRLTPRFARLVTVLPGADAGRVEALVTEKLERVIREVDEVKDIRSSSSSNVSFIAIELKDTVDEVGAENAWSRIRDKAEDARLEMPSEVLAPEFKEFDITASASILALKWNLEAKPNYAIMYRLVKQLRDEIDRIPGTEKTEIYGAPEEEILVELDPDTMTALGLNAMQVSHAISSSDSKVSAGLLRSNDDNILLEIAGELDTLARVGSIPVQTMENRFVELASIANVQKTIRAPLATKLLLDNGDAIAVGTQIDPGTRIDHWAKLLDARLEAFETALPEGITLERVFEQHRFVKSRLSNLFNNLLYGAAAIFAVILVMMGWRAACVVGLALPLVSLAVLASMYWLGVPIHQISITGLIISLGLMIDNAIVVVDEIAQQLRHGCSRLDAVQKATSFLMMPLVGSTITTTLSFSPIILMEGMSGEFVGAIGTVAVVAVSASLILALTVISTVGGFVLPNSESKGWLHRGVSCRWLSRFYRRIVELALHYPAAGVLIGIALPIMGFVVAADLPEQFFPPAERNQFRIDLELPATSSINATERCAKALRAQLEADPRIEAVKWFLGESALMFYYNVLPLRQNVPQYGQAIVECRPGTDVRKLLLELQPVVESSFPNASVLLRQLEQGPSFDAPIEVRIAGPDPKTLRRIGDEIRLLLTQTRHVHHTRATFSESLPKVSFAIDEQQARLAGLDHVTIAQKLNAALEGITGGSVVEATEELPVRVRVSGRQREDLSRVASMDLLPVADPSFPRGHSDAVGYRGVPISAISRLALVAETVSIFRHNGERMNEVQAFLDAGVLPSVVSAEFRQRLANSSIDIPPGYSITYGGAEERRDDAVGELVANMFVVVALMITALVVSLGSFRLAALLFSVAGLAVGLGLGSLWLVGYPWGFMSMVGMMGMIGVAVNDSIVVLAAIRSLPVEKATDVPSMCGRIMDSTRHILSTTLTTIVGFTPLFLFGGEFWSPVAVAISGGVGGATIIALLLVPCAYRLLCQQGS